MHLTCSLKCMSFWVDMTRCLSSWRRTLKVELITVQQIARQPMLLSWWCPQRVKTNCCLLKLSIFLAWRIRCSSQIEHVTISSFNAIHRTDLEKNLMRKGCYGLSASSPGFVRAYLRPRKSLPIIMAIRVGFASDMGRCHECIWVGFLPCFPYKGDACSFCCYDYEKPKRSKICLCPVSHSSFTWISIRVLVSSILDRRKDQHIDW